MISIVVVYNDQRLLDTMLRASLARQRQEHEFIALDNTTKRYPSAAAALNEGGRRARGDFILFAHQDISFASEAWLEEAARWLDSLPNLGIAGVAGAQAAIDSPGHVLVSNIEDNVPPQRVSTYTIAEPEIVDSVDECAFFVPKEVFLRFPLDERTCNGWHLYAVDLALTVRAAGLDAYVLPIHLYHRSGGALVTVMGFTSLVGSYFQGLRRVVRKHRGRYQYIRTTCGTWSTRRSIIFQRFPPADVFRAVLGWARRAALG